MDTRAITGLLAAVVVLSPALLTGAYSSNTTFTVGGDKNWIVPVSNSGPNYTAWAQNITARVGDSLYFKYNPNGHNVLQVNSTVFQACDTSDYLHVWDTGDTTVVLQEAGTQYFMCGAPHHCSLGQAFSLNVLPGLTPTSPSIPSVLSPPGAAPSNILHHSLVWAVVYGFVTSTVLLSSSLFS